MDVEEPIFQPFPSDIVFQNFEPYQTYEVPLQLRNNDKVSATFQPIFISYWMKIVLSMVFNIKKILIII